MYLLELEVLSFLDICPGVGLLDPMLVLFLAIQGTSILFSIMAAPTYIPINSVGGFPFPHSPPAFIIHRPFDDGHSDWCEVTPYCSFDLHFSYMPANLENSEVATGLEKVSFHSNP